MKNNPPNVQDEKKYPFTLKNGAVVDIKTGLMQKESLVAFAKKAL